MNLQPLCLSDREQLEPFLLHSGRQSCEFAFSNLVLWSDSYHPSWCFTGDHLYLVMDGESMPMFAPGGANGPSVTALLHVSDALIAEGHSGSFDHVDAGYLQTHPEISKYFMAERMDSRYDEYIYLAENLVTLRGKLLSKKRNLISGFQKNYPDAAVEPLTSSNLDEALAVQRDWLAGQEEPRSLEMIHENTALDVLARNFNDLPVEGIAVRAEGRVISFAVYSQISSGIWTVHFEKTRYEYKGASQFVNHETAIRLQGRTRLINREQDLAIAGLRQAKRSYQPLFMLQNYRLIRRMQGS